MIYRRVGAVREEQTHERELCFVAPAGDGDSEKRKFHVGTEGGEIIHVSRFCGKPRLHRVDIALNHSPYNIYIEHHLRMACLTKGPLRLRGCRKVQLSERADAWTVSAIKTIGQTRELAACNTLASEPG